MGNKCGAHTVPYIKNKNFSSTVEHEATPQILGMVKKVEHLVRIEK